MIWPALIGAGVSIVGGLLKKKNADKNAKNAQFKPFNSTGDLGEAIISKGNRPGDSAVIRNRDTTASGEARDFFEGEFNRFAADETGRGQFGTDTLQQGQNLFNPALNEALGAGFDQSNAATGDFLARNRQQADSLGSQGNRGVNSLFNGPSAAGNARTAGGAAQSLLNSGLDFNQLAADRTAQLTDLARPGEETATNQKFQSLFGSGRLGTTGGAQALGQLQQAQQRAATERGIAGMTFAQQQQQQQLQQAQGFLGAGNQAIGLDQSLAANQGQIGAGLLNSQQGAEAAGLNANVAQDERGISRGAQRLQTVEGLFNFGTQQQEAPASSASKALLAQSPLDDRLFNNAQLALQGTSVASGNAAAAAQIAQSGGSPFGAALQGIGAGIFASDDMFKKD